MRTYQLCTYHLATEEAAADYLPRWKAHIGSLKALEIETHGIFSVPSDPKMVVALISHDASVDPVAIISAYRDSDDFKADMVGFDEANMVQDDKLILKPANGSPLS